MVCLECQRIVLKGDRCDKCGKTLPGYGKLPEKYCDKAGTLKQKTLLLRSGDLSKADFVGWLDSQEERAWSVMDETEHSRIDPDALADVAEELDMGRKSVATYLKALETVREWLSTGKHELLQTAIALAAKGDTLMDQTLQLNWQTHQNFMDSTREFLIQQGYSPD